MTQHPKRIANMLRRRAQGLTHKEIAAEHDLSRQHVGRLLAENYSLLGKHKNPDLDNYTESDIDKG